MNTPFPSSARLSRNEARVPVGTQADRIFNKFGGVPALKRALANVGVARSLSALYRWNLPKNRGGSNGIIPTSAQADVVKAARLEGVHLTAEDWSPMAHQVEEAV